MEPEPWLLSLGEIAEYVVLTGFDFAALCAMTRIGRGWPLQLLALVALFGVNVLGDCLWRLGLMSIEHWLTVLFVLRACVMTASIVCLSRDRLGRRVFLAIVFNAYAVCYESVFDFLAYRHYDTGGSNVFGLPAEAAGVIGLVVVSVMVLLFVFWVLPRIPRDNPKFRWTDYSLVAAVSFSCVFASGFWPVSVVSAPGPCCMPFVLASAVMWVGFPVVCRSINDLMLNTDVEHGLELLMAEVKVRRAAIDETRRLRHDMRFHRAQIAEYELSGQHEKVLAYLRQLDAEAAKTPTASLVWCGNETVNAVLSGCSRKAAAKGVELVATAEVDPSIPLPDVELVAVVANLVENAIEASGKREGQGLRSRSREELLTVSAGQHNENGEPPPLTLTFPLDLSPKVTCTLRQHDYGIGITVANPVPPDFALSARGLPCAEPGVGMESVRRIVKKRSGTWSYELKDGVLTCQVVLIFGG